MITTDEYAATLKLVLHDIHEIDATHGDYDRREKLVLAALFEAKSLGFACGYRFDPNEPEWPVAFIELPTGQVSWHMPQHPVPYDGHSTEEKYERVLGWINSTPEEEL